jgi:hypothetical protein
MRLAGCVPYIPIYSIYQIINYIPMILPQKLLFLKKKLLKSKKCMAMTFIQLPKALMEIALIDSMADLGDIVAVADVDISRDSREEDVNRGQRRLSQWLPENPSRFGWI